MTVSFETNPTSSGYQIIDTSTDTSSSTGKSFRLFDMNMTQFYESDLIPASQIITTIPYDSWPTSANLYVAVTMLYNKPGSAPDSLQQTYLLPKTLNIKS